MCFPLAPHNVADFRFYCLWGHLTCGLNLWKQKHSLHCKCFCMFCAAGSRCHFLCRHGCLQTALIASTPDCDIHSHRPEYRTLIEHNIFIQIDSKKLLVDSQNPKFTCIYIVTHLSFLLHEDLVFVQHIFISRPAGTQSTPNVHSQIRSCTGWWSATEFICWFAIPASSL